MFIKGGNDTREDGLLTLRAVVLGARRKREVRGLVAEFWSGRLGYCVVIGVPVEYDGVPYACIQSERDVAQNALAGCHYDGVGSTSIVASISLRRVRRPPGLNGWGWCDDC